MTTKTETVRIKIQGSKPTIEKMVETLEKTFLFTSSARILKNDKDTKYHAFLDVNPYYLKTIPLKEQL